MQTPPSSSSSGSYGDLRRPSSLESKDLHACNHRYDTDIHQVRYTLELRRRTAKDMTLEIEALCKRKVREDFEGTLE
jgi:hypothetical protein